MKLTVWECEKCGTLYRAERKDCRHAEGKSGYGVYYQCRRVELRVVRSTAA